MTTYAVGDLQGCFSELEQLLDLLNFNPNHDQLWLAGDLVNRGPESLQVLRFASGLGDRVRCVLGNHDLHLLAVAYSGARSKRSDTLQAILDAPDRDDLLDWLRHQPFCHFNPELGYVMHSFLHSSDLGACRGSGLCKRGRVRFTESRLQSLL